MATNLDGTTGEEGAMSNPRLDQSATQASAVPPKEVTDRGAIFTFADILVAWIAVIVAFSLLGVLSVVH
jgi:hypothetical protein